MQWLARWKFNKIVKCCTDDHGLVYFYILNNILKVAEVVAYLSES